MSEISRQRYRDLTKPLRVHFIGEDGIDAGGVKKEFFQLLVTELLCPDYGMLVYQQVRLLEQQNELSITKYMPLARNSCCRNTLFQCEASSHTPTYISSSGLYRS